MGTFPLVQLISGVIAFEVLQLLGTSLLWFAISCFVPSVIFRGHGTHNTILASDCCVGSSLFCRQRGYSIALSESDRTLSRSPFGRLLNDYDFSLRVMFATCVGSMGRLTSI